MPDRIIDKLNNSMPYLVNKTGQDYEAIIGKEEYTEEVEIVNSEDFNCGAIANELEMARAFVENEIQQNDTDTMEEDYLETVINFFTTLYRFIEEEDDNLRNRFYSLIRRNGNTKWMTKWSFLDVFSYYFDTENLYLIENPIESTENVIINSNFEDMTGAEFDDWTRSESGSSTVTVTTTNQFEEDNAVDIYINSGDAAYIYQTTPSQSSGWYKTEVFYKDDGNSSGDAVSITIQRSGDNYYWDDINKIWSSSYKEVTAPSSLTYILKEIWFELTDSRTITYTLKGVDTSTSNYHVYYDYVKLGPVKTYPSIKILVVSIGTSTYSMAFWDNGIDPIGGTDYQYASFLDFEYIEGPGGLHTQKIYEDLLNKIKVGGTKAIFEIISRTGV